jgi:hypothetical protein
MTIQEQYARTFTQCVEVAANLGRIVVLPKANELQLDLDSEGDLVAFQARFTRLREILGETKDKGCVLYTIAPSPSKRPGRYHVTVSLPLDVRDNAHRIFLQACLGSDPLREILNWRRNEAGDPQPSLFFELPTGVEEMPL